VFYLLSNQNPKISFLDTTKILFRLRYNPTNPNANKNGCESSPNINPVIEKVDLAEVIGVYQANMAEVNNLKYGGLIKKTKFDGIYIYSFTSKAQ